MEFPGGDLLDEQGQGKRTEPLAEVRESQRLLKGGGKNVENRQLSTFQYITNPQTSWLELINNDEGWYRVGKIKRVLKKEKGINPKNSRRGKKNTARLDTLIAKTTRKGQVVNGGRI